jgi:hypothetical protein
VLKINFINPSIPKGYLGFKYILSKGNYYLLGGETMIKIENPQELVFAYGDAGDQEGRLTSIDEAILFFPVQNYREIEASKKYGVDHPAEIAKIMLPVDKLITISNEFYDEDNLKREEMIDGKGADDIIHGFQLSTSGLMEELGYTLVALSLGDQEDDDFGGLSDRHFYMIQKSYNETLELLRGVQLNPVAKLNNMYWDTSKIPGPDGNMRILFDYLEGNPDFIKVGDVIFHDNLNGEYFFVTGENSRVNRNDEEDEDDLLCVECGGYGCDCHLEDEDDEEENELFSEDDDEDDEDWLNDEDEE